MSKKDKLIYKVQTELNKEYEIKVRIGDAHDGDHNVFGTCPYETEPENDNQYIFKSVTESKWNLSVGYQITENILWSMSLSEINGNSDYLKNNTVQFLMGIGAALVPLKQ